MRILRTALAVTSLTLALLAFPSATATHDTCDGENEVVMDDLRDSRIDEYHVECGSLSDPCFTTDSCPRGCGGGTDSPVTWLIGPIYCVSASGAAVAPCQGPNEYVMADVEDTLADPTRPECGSLTDPCFVDHSCFGACSYDDWVITWVFGPVYCTASADAAWAPCTGPNEHVYRDVSDTLGGNVQCGSLTDPCFQSGGCGGCGPDLVEWVIGPIYCTASASGGDFTCDNGNMYVVEDLAETMEDPLRPSCGSLHDPCFANGSRCYGCGPDPLEWVIGPIYCV